MRPWLAFLLAMTACDASLDGSAPPPLAPGAGLVAGKLRVVTWNIETVGNRGTSQYNATLSVLGRLGADVVMLNEVDAAVDLTAVSQLAADAGYPSLVVSAGSSFGSDRAAVLSRFPIVSSTSHTAAALSGSSTANDVTRLPLEVVIDLPEVDQHLTVVALHLKSGPENTDEFRRAIESFRTAQILEPRDPARDLYLVAGDLNEEVADLPLSPASFQFAPAGLPTSFRIGPDISAEMSSGGLANDPFLFLHGAGVLELDARQTNGSQTTRPVSGRRLDYLLASPALRALAPAAEVYNSTLDGTGIGLPKLGAPLSSGTSAAAADHLPVLMDVALPASTPLQEELLLSFKDTATLPGIGAVANEDVVLFDPATESWSLFFDGSDVGLSGATIDGLALTTAGELLLSFEAVETLGGLTIDDSDVVRFVASSLGANTSGSFSLFFDASVRGFSTDNEDIDAIAIAPDGRLLLSTLGPYNASGLAGDDTDIVAVNLSTGAVSLFFDGSAEGLLASSAQDIDGLALSADGLLFSIQGDAVQNGASLFDEDILLGGPGRGLGAVSLSLRGLGIDPTEDVAGLEVLSGQP